MSNGNVRLQRKRRKARGKNLPPYQKNTYELIDGNLTHYPCAYCTIKRAWLSVGLADIHRCKERECCHYSEGVL